MPSRCSIKHPVSAPPFSARCTINPSLILLLLDGPQNMLSHSSNCESFHSHQLMQTRHCFPLKTPCHKYRLVSRPPVAPTQGDVNIKIFFEILDELEQRHSVFCPAPNIEGVAAGCFPALICQFVGTSQIFHVKHVARLFAITINGDLF